MDFGRPLLQREPDGRKAPLRLFADIAPLYLALMVGVPIATVVAVWDLVVVRRFGRALFALGFGAVAALGITVGLLVAVDAGIDRAIAVFGAQLAEVGCGAVLYQILRAPVRGHRLLNGQLVSTSLLVFGALVFQFAVPFEVLWTMHHPLFLLLGTA